ncbi:MAG: DNA-3-methyladenine glycosylase 2 family protein [Actinomycetota bacterium]
MIDDFERCYRAVESRDARFDGWLFTAVTSTGIYCRPSCPATTPRRKNVRFFRSAAAAQSAGFRSCRRCRPDASPGSPEWDVRGDLVGRAMRLIADGVVDREGVAGLARRLGYSERQLNRQLLAEVGAGPLAVARAQRAQTARLLIEATDLAMFEIAFAAGFSSVRQFNDVVRAVFAVTLTELRRGGRATSQVSGSAITLRLPYRAPLAADELIAFFEHRVVAGVGEVVDGSYRRSTALPHGPGLIELSPRDGHVLCRLKLTDLRDLSSAVQRCRRLLDLDADPTAIGKVLRADPLLRPLVRRVPGRRLPGSTDPHELAVRAVLGQQVSVAGARTTAGRLVEAYGSPLSGPNDGVTHLWPSAGDLAGAELMELGMPSARRDTIRRLSGALANGEITLDAGANWDDVFEQLVSLKGIGSWTASYIVMRCLGNPDAFMASDLGVLRGARKLGLPGTPRALEEVAERWRPWRAYALQYLWRA